MGARCGDFSTEPNALLRILCECPPPMGPHSYPMKVLADARPISAPSGATTSDVRADASRLDAVLAIARDLQSLEPEWRRFEQYADATVFQSFDWLSLWHRHIGSKHGVRVAVVLGHTPAGELLFLLPLAVTPGPIRRLTFLGDGLCD